MISKRMNTIFIIIAVILLAIMIVIVNIYTGIGIFWSFIRLLEQMTSPTSIFFIIIAITIWFMNKKRIGLRVSLYILITIAFISLYNTMHIVDVASREISKNKAAINTIISMVNALMDGGELQEYEISEFTHGAYAPLIEWANTYAIKVQDIMNRMNHDAEELKLNEVLDTTILKESRNLSIAIDKLQHAYNIVESYDNLLQDEIETERQRWKNIILELDIPDSDKIRLIQSEESGETKEKPLKILFTTYRKAIIAKINYVSWLQNNQNIISYKGDQIVVSSENGINEHNSLVLEIQKTNEEALAYWDKIYKSVQQQIDKAVKDANSYTK